MRFHKTMNPRDGNNVFVKDLPDDLVSAWYAIKWRTRFKCEVFLTLSNASQELLTWFKFSCDFVVWYQSNFSYRRINLLNRTRITRWVSLSLVSRIVQGFFNLIKLWKICVNGAHNSTNKGYRNDKTNYNRTVWKFCGIYQPFSESTGDMMCNAMAICISSHILHTMMTPSIRNIFRVTGPLCREFPSQRPVTRSFDVFFDLCLNKRFNKQSSRWWSEMPWCSLWRSPV